MTKPSKLQLIITILLTISILIFIFSNSFDSQQISAEKSGKILELLYKFLRENAPSHSTVRKLAHIAEFALLGMSLAGLSVTLRIKPIIPLFTGLVSALIDETIQTFTGRGSMVSDVWIDFAGVCLGYLIVTGIRFLIKSIKRKNAYYPQN